MLAQRKEYTVYILYSRKDKGLYVGYTGSIRHRLAEHNAGEVRSTKHRRPLDVIHTETFKTKGDALEREKFLKSLWGSREKKKILRAYLEN